MRKCLIAVLLLGVLLSACSSKKQSLEAFYTEEGVVNVDKVVILDGTTGITKTIIDSDQISEFLALVKDIEFTPENNQERRYGFQYAITLYDGDTQFNFSLGQIGETYYKTNPDIYPIVDEYYKNLENIE